MTSLYGVNLLSWQFPLMRDCHALSSESFFHYRSHIKTMENIVYILTIQETEGSLGILPYFKPQVFISAMKANETLEALNKKKKPYCGYFYKIEEGTIDYEVWPS